MSADTPDRTLGEIARETGTTDRLTQPGDLDPEGDALVDIASHSEGEVLHLRVCPCGQPLPHPDALAPHLLREHQPADFGLEPLWGDAE